MANAGQSSCHWSRGRRLQKRQKRQGMTNHCAIGRLMPFLPGFRSPESLSWYHSRISTMTVPGLKYELQTPSFSFSEHDYETWMLKPLNSFDTVTFLEFLPCERMKMYSPLPILSRFLFASDLKRKLFFCIFVR